MPPSNTPRNSYRSVECPEVPSHSSWYSDELEPEGRFSSHRQYDKSGSSSRSSHRESGHPSSSARYSYHESEAPSSQPHISSSIPRAKTTAAPSSKNPFARLLATGDLPRSNNPFSRHESSRHAGSSGSLHRSNAVHSRSRSSYQTSSHRKSAGPHHSSSASTIRGPASTVHSSSPSSMDEHLDSYAGALVPQRSQTVAQRLSSGSRYYGNKQPARSGSTSSSRTGSSRTTESTSSQTSANAQNVTYNITNINIGSNNIGKGTDDLLAGMSTIKIGEPSGYAGHSRITSSSSLSGRRTPYPEPGSIWECDCDESLEDWPDWESD
ncbi:hypothetical protein GJ744_005096 [Endocarpon pusillum]|uniref:Uncharacterized protein n=1 Tax=Endocarpon pusillum TaxID=364733 RepID=A0A8H7AN47_9EURO|nr:hypothetical protein GJ744_005096 [Endocarpon pusillum]